MSFFSLDASIVYLFLIITLIVGLWYSGGIKNLRDYAIGSGTFSNAVLFATLSATMVGGYQLVGVTGEIYESGIIYCGSCLAAFTGFVFSFFIVLPNIDSRFKGSISIADLADKLYGPIAYKLTAAFGIINCATILCIQFIALGSILAQFLEIPYSYGVAIPAGILIVYSTLGGIRSVAMTDLIQFCVLIVMVPMLAKFGLDYNGGIVEVFKSAPRDHFMFFGHSNFLEYLARFIFLCFPLAHLEPAVTQRLLMCKGISTRRRVSFSFLAMLLFLQTMSVLIAFSVLAVSKDVGASRAFAEAMAVFFPTGLRGLMVAGILAAVMSTADSCLNTASILAAQLLGLDKEKRRSVFSVKIMALIISVAALYVSLNELNIIRVGAVADLAVAVFVNVPLVIGICRIKVSRKLYYISMSSCIVVVLIMFSLNSPALYYPVIGAVVSASILLSKQIVSFDYLGFALSFPRMVAKPLLGIFRFLKSNVRIGKIYQIITRQCHTTFEKYSSSYFAFGVFCVFNYVFPLLNKNYLYGNAFRVDTVFYVMGIAMCIVLLMRRHLTRVSDRMFAVYWVFTLLYCLPFMSVFLFLQNNSSLSWLVNMVLGIMLLASLVPWMMFLVLTIFGSLTALVLSVIMDPSILFRFSEANLDIVTYAVLFSLLIGSLFVRHRQVQQEEKAAMMQLFSSAIAHELRSPLAATQMQAGMLIDASNEKNNESKKGGEYRGLVLESAAQLQRLTARGLQSIEMLLLAVREDLIIRDGGVYSISKRVKIALSEYIMANPSRKNSISFKGGNDFEFFGSDLFVKHIVFNILENAFKHGGADVRVEVEIVDNVVHIKDDGRGISPENKKKIFDRFFTTSGYGNGIGLSFCIRAMQKMGGHITCDSVEGEYTRFSLHFPTYSS